MLYSVELQLKIIGGDNPSLVTGYHLYSFFMHLIEGVNPTLAATLHEEGGPKPFTLSLLSTRNQGEKRNTPVQVDQAHLRLTLLQEEVFASLVDAVWRLPPEANLSLGGARVVCSGLATTPDQSPAAAFTSFQELMENADNGPKLRLSFLSPTTFRSKGERNILFPEPSLVLGSLLARWNAYAPASLKLNPNDIGINSIRLSGYRLATNMLDFGSYQELGFYGQATYEPGSHLRENQLKALNALVNFAFFSGVGAKTTMGMGQCRRLKDARPLSNRAGGDPKERRRSAPGNQGESGTH